MAQKTQRKMWDPNCPIVSGKYNFKIGSYDCIYIFKNYFIIIFSVINFQSLVISNT